jgi:hypothetical protein
MGRHLGACIRTVADVQAGKPSRHISFRYNKGTQACARNPEIWVRPIRADVATNEVLGL